MIKKLGKTNRRGFLTGLMAGAGAAAAVAATSGSVRAAADQPEAGEQGSALYKRGPEAERYYKTLYR